jgi:arylsulfatase A-like enzyme
MSFVRLAAANLPGTISPVYSHRYSSHSPYRMPIAVAIGLASLIVVGCGNGDPRRALLPSQGFILISLDTVSAEHLSLYGYHRETSPFLDSVASRGVVFDNAYVQLPGTLPSHMSIFTCLYPDQHNVFPPDGVLAESIPTLPELFKRAGYRTIGHTDGGFVSGRFGFSRGFDLYDDRRFILWGGVNHTFARGLASLGELAPDERFFLFVHTYAAHDPYNPPRRCRDLYWDGPPPEGTELSASNVLRAHNTGVAPLSPEVVAYYASQYDGEIHCLDEEIGHFFDGLEELGLADRTTIMITADHGEEFLEHGKLVHEQIYQENLHVPLIIIIPGVEGGRRVEQVVESIDLAPTLFDLAGIEAPPNVPGRSLLPLVLGYGAAPDEEAFSQAMSGERGVYSRTGDELFHLVRYDPGPEARNQPVTVASAFQLWVPPGRLSLSAQAYVEPAEMRLELDGVEDSQVLLQPDRWSDVIVAVPEDGVSHFLRLTSDTCVPVPDSPQRDVGRCRSFVVRGLPGLRNELYRSDIDRDETRDLAAGHVAECQALGRRLDGHHLEPVGPAEAAPLEEHVEEQLRELGYIE